MLRIKNYIFFGLGLSFGVCLCADGDFTIDEIKALVEGAVRTDVITVSDIKHRSFDGMEHTLDDLILECGKDQRGDHLGITLEKEDIDRYLRAMSRGEDVSPEILTTQAKAFGYDTLEEFYEDLKRLYRANAALESEVHSLLTVTEQEARDYAQKNPVYKEGVFYLQTALVPLDSSENKDKLKHAIADGSYTENIDWSDPFDVAYKELAQDKDFIRDMNIGEVKAIEIAEGLQVYKLKNNIKPTPLTFEERKKSIINTLRDEKFSDVLKKYNDEIMQELTVTRF